MLHVIDFRTLLSVVSLYMPGVVLKNTVYSEKGSGHVCFAAGALYALVNLVTALVPSDTACLASSPGRIRRTAVWISRLVTVGFLL